MSSRPTAAGRKRRNGLARFRAVELEVQAALSAGWTVLALYEEKRDRLATSYAQFARYASVAPCDGRTSPPDARSPRIFGEPAFVMDAFKVHARR